MESNSNNSDESGILFSKDIKNQILKTRKKILLTGASGTVGQEVLKQMINLCKNKDYKYITLGVDTDNANAVHIYKKNGFKIYETDIDKYGKYYKMILTI